MQKFRFLQIFLYRKLNLTICIYNKIYVIRDLYDTGGSILNFVQCIINILCKSNRDSYFIYCSGCMNSVLTTHNISSILHAHTIKSNVGKSRNPIKYSDCVKNIDLYGA